MFSTLDPVQLTGEGEYNLNSLKEEEVTQSFLGMHQSVRGCQNEEHYDECTTRWYIENVREKCGCLPLFIALSDQVGSFFLQIMFQSYLKFLLLIMNSSQSNGLSSVLFLKILPFILLEVIFFSVLALTTKLLLK